MPSETKAISGINGRDGLGWKSSGGAMLRVPSVLIIGTMATRRETGMIYLSYLYLVHCFLQLDIAYLAILKICIYKSKHVLVLIVKPILMTHIK